MRSLLQSICLYDVRPGHWSIREGPAWQELTQGKLTVVEYHFHCRTDDRARKGSRQHQPNSAGRFTWIPELCESEDVCDAADWHERNLPKRQGGREVTDSVC
jgi:hypothetical protein